MYQIRCLLACPIFVVVVGSWRDVWTRKPNTIKAFLKYKFSLSFGLLVLLAGWVGCAPNNDFHHRLHFKWYVMVYSGQGGSGGCVWGKTRSNGGLASMWSCSSAAVSPRLLGGYYHNLGFGKRLRFYNVIANQWSILLCYQTIAGDVWSQR